MPKIKVLLIEDNRLLREGTTALLNEQADLHAVGTAGNKSAAAKAKKMSPNVILLDLGLKSHSSIKVLEEIKKTHPKAEVVVMDLIPSHNGDLESIQTSVSGYVPKNATIDEFLRTIRAVVKGVKVPVPPMVDSLFSKIVESAIEQGSVKQVINSVKLSAREQAVLNHLAEGKSIIQTSRDLKLEFFTVKAHIRNILDKLALHTRLELTAFAKKNKPTGKAPKRAPKKARTTRS